MPERTSLRPLFAVADGTPGRTLPDLLDAAQRGTLAVYVRAGAFEHDADHLAPGHRELREFRAAGVSPIAWSPASDEPLRLVRWPGELGQVVTGHCTLRALPEIEARYRGARLLVPQEVWEREQGALLVSAVTQGARLLVDPADVAALDGADGAERVAKPAGRVAGAKAKRAEVHKKATAAVKLGVAVDCTTGESLVSIHALARHLAAQKLDEARQAGEVSGNATSVFGWTARTLRTDLDDWRPPAPMKLNGDGLRPR